MGYKPNTSKYSTKVKFDVTSMVAFDDAARRGRDRQKEKKKIINKDSRKRIEIHSRIYELKDKGFPKEEALKRITTEFPNSEFEGFFESWIENIYKKNKKPVFHNTSIDDDREI